MRIGLVAGESSGDLLGAGLVKAIKEQYPDAVFEGVAGPEMLAAGCDQWEAAESLAVFGLIEPLAHLPRLLRLRKSLVERWSASPPDVFVGVDAPDFNLGLEKRLRAAGIKTVHYVSPSIWAWRPGRIKTVKAAADKVLCILPFEKALYDAAEVDATFVGHPKADSTPALIDVPAAREALGINAHEVVAVLPGSRLSEIKNLGEVFFAAAATIATAKPDVRFVTPVATPSLKAMIEAQIDAAGLGDKVLLLEGDSERAMIAADVVLLASGTAALESALLAKPTVAAYRIGKLTYAIVKQTSLKKMTHFTLPNILTETPLVPEFIQDDVNSAAIAKEVVDLLDRPDRRQFIADRFARLRVELAQNSDQRAADAVIELAKL
ncbi:MAG: lipid-A-disaccharide synthase [Gammaproteobacteria bacterium]|jgi:lipid-A-disaccharide synthase|nr:lipid-A-disaccharide synthase [Gammaproteobacteria bacterium]